MPGIVLRFRSVDCDDGVKRIVAQAHDEKTGELVRSYSLPMMSAWLRKNGYSWRFGSSGIYDKTG